MFGSQRRKERKIAAQKAQAEADRQAAIKTGETGTAVEVSAALAVAQNETLREALKEGAMAAFAQDRPENFQSYIVWANEKEKEEQATSDLLKLTATLETADPASVVSLAVKGMDGKQKQNFLNECLYWSVRKAIGKEDFVKALLGAGADAAFKSSSGVPSVVLDWAVHLGKPLSLVKLLCDHGAGIDDIVFHYTVSGNRSVDLEKAKYYKEQLQPSPQKEFAAKAAAYAEDGDLSPKAIALLLEMQEQIRDLTEEVRMLTGKVENLSPQKAAPKASAKAREYPSVG